MLITPDFEPIPPQDAVKRLRAIDERLSIKWVKSAAGPYWAIIERWPQGDRRWQLVQEGQVREHEAFDIRAMLPPDCSAAEAEGFVLRHFTRVEDPKKEAEAAIAKVQKFNQAAKAQHVEKFLEEQEFKTARTSKHEHEVALGLEKAHPMVSGIGEGTKPKRAARKKAE